MSLQKIAEYLFPAGNFAQIRANAPDRATYNIEATRDLVKNQPAFMAPFAPVAAATMSLPYDFIQASGRARDKFFKANPTSFGIDDYGEVPIGPSFSDLTKAVAAENPLKSLAERTYGATLGLADKMNLTSGKAAPSDAFEYYNKDFFNQNRSGILGTNEAQNITKSLPPDAVLNEFDNITNTGVNQGGRGIIDLIKSGGQKVLDFAAPIAKDVAGRSIASQALGKAGFMVGGIPGALAGMIFGGAKGGDLFNAPYIGGVTTFDPITGELISGEELDKLNAAGGYYSDVARAARSRDARIANMRQRQALGKRISEANLARLEEQQAREEAARQAEARAMAEANRAAGIGGYQAGYSDDFMTGGGSQRNEEQESRSPGSSGPGGSDTMGSS
jgi:hypothetical protein